MRISKSDIVFLSGLVLIIVGVIAGVKIITLVGLFAAAFSFGFGLSRFIREHKRRRALAKSRWKDTEAEREIEREQRGQLPYK